jgi:hypothetical protein
MKRKWQFNKEFLVFNPFFYLKEKYTHKLFWIIMPIIAMVLKGVGGFLESQGVERNWFTLMLRSDTSFDRFFTDTFSSIWTFFTPQTQEDIVMFIFMYFTVALLTYVKLMMLNYFFFKFFYMFCFTKEELSLEGIIKKNIDFYPKYTKEDIYEVSESDLNEIELYKKC